MISVFTPSHDPKYLEECYQSLCDQTVQDWEWVVVLNNGAEWKRTWFDERVSVYTNDRPNMGVGYYKKFAVAQTHGNILLELDHDDLLLDEALDIIQYAFDTNPDVGFIYSDTSQINADGSPNKDEFLASHGWEYYYSWDMFAAKSFEPHPHNMSYIWYAPNHVRAFRRSVYDEVGGYDSSLQVLDDQDLMSRMYRATKFMHINHPLYFQRITGENTQTQRNAEIQAGTVEMYQRDIEANALAWAKREGLLALDLGSHHNKAEGFLGVDLRPGPGVDYVGDFLDMDIAPNSVGVIRAHDFMEHIENKLAFIEWCFEKLAHGGMLLSMTPSSDGRGAFQDPTHVAFYNENSFWYYTQRDYAEYIDFKGRFQVSCLRSFFPSDWHRQNHIPYVQANLIAVKKDGREFGGLLMI